MFGLKIKKNVKKPEKPSNKNQSLSDRLKHTRTGLFGEFFSRNKTTIDDITLNELKNRLLMADIGVKTTDTEEGIRSTRNAGESLISITEGLIAFQKLIDQNVDFCLIVCRPTRGQHLASNQWVQIHSRP